MGSATDIAPVAGAVPAPAWRVAAGKLTPPPVGFALLVRRRLLAMLSRGVDATPVTLVSGPVGAGKTVLAATWLRAERGGRRIAWLSLDEADDDPAVLCVDIAAALARAGIDLPGLPGQVDDQPPASVAFLTALAASLSGLSRPVVLIIDHADCLTRPAATHALDRLVRYAGNQLRLVLCARADPPLPLHRYRLADALTEIRADRLAFTAEETGELLATLGAPVSADVAVAMQEASGGWAAALRLAAAPLRQGADPHRLLTALAADDGGVLWHLFADVLERQPAPVRRFLLQVSVPAELWPDLVQQLTGHSSARRLLVTLARTNVFVEQADGAPGGHRIPPLFREMLAAQLAYEFPDEFTAVHLACAAWHAAIGQLATAAQHATTAGDLSLAAQLLIDDWTAGRLLGRGDRQEPATPPEARGRDAAVLRAAAAVGRAATPSRSDLTLAAAAAGDPAARPALRISAALVCAVAVDADVPEVRAAAAAAPHLLAELPDKHHERRTLTAILAAAEASALLRTDAADAVLLDALRAAVATGRGTGVGPPLARCYAALALLEALHGRLRTAEDLLATHESLCDEWLLPRTDRSPAAATAAAWVAAERGEHADVRSWMDRAHQRTAHPDAGLIAPLLAVLAGRQRRARGELDSAEQALSPVSSTADLPAWVRVRVTVEHVRICFARRQAETGLHLVDELGEDSHAAMLRITAAALGLSGPPTAQLVDPGEDLLDVAVELDIARACLDVDDGDIRSAVAVLARALRQGESERLRRPFLEAPPQVRPLLRRQPALAAAAAWLNPSAPPVPLARRASGAAGPSVHPAAAAPLIPPQLSARELEVLRCLADMLSTGEIAAALFVSVNTVRTHIRSILRKLAVGRRNQAIRRAWELGLVEHGEGPGRLPQSVGAGS